MLTKREGKGIQDLIQDYTIFTKREGKWMFFENILNFY